MDWSPESATNAYFDTLKLCNRQKEQRNSDKLKEIESNEFISALAAGMSAKLIVEVTSEESPSTTLALAAAARQTGGKLVSIVSQPKLDLSRKVIEDSGLEDTVEFITGDPLEELPKYVMVVANNLRAGKQGLEGHLKGMEKHKVKVRSMKHAIGRGMEITTIGKSNEPRSPFRAPERNASLRRRTARSQWVVRNIFFV